MSRTTLEKNPFFKEKMKELGFKKDKHDRFYRLAEDAQQTIGFGHAHHGEKGATYYTCTVSWNYQSLIELARKLGIILSPIGKHLGYLMPEETYLEWRIAEEDSEEDVLKTMNIIVEAIEKYALPLMDEYHDLKRLVEDENDGVLPKSLYIDQQLIPLAYYFLGDISKANDYIHNTLAQLKRESGVDDNRHVVCDNYEEIRFAHLDRAYHNYKKFAEKFKSTLGQLHI